MSNPFQLYSVTLQRPTNIVQSVIGNFSGQPKVQEIITCQGSYLQVLSPDSNLGKITCILSYNCFGILRSIGAFRIAGSNKDHLIVSSDSGRIAILEFKLEKNTFEQVHLETFGKTGIRRVVPGQYLAVDPKGRATLIASVEKNRLVYVLNRDAQANITISSPLEAHTSRTLVYSVIGIDVGYDNPTFASLEVDYSELDDNNEYQKKLTYYELDLGLNHVIRKWTDEVDRDANFLLQVPGGSDGPSGVLIGSPNYITYRHINQQLLSVPIPRRRSSRHDDEDINIICGVMHKMRDAFFFLVQSNLGDLYKVNILLEETDNKKALELRIKYFDTIPVATSLNILKSGFLFAACESGNHLFYQFNKLGDDDEELEISSTDYADGATKRSLDFKRTNITFMPKPLDNIQVVDILSSLNPLTGSQIVNLTRDDTPQIYTISGQGARSTFRSLEFGLPVTEIVTSELPAVPLAVWTTKLRQSSSSSSIGNDEETYDKYILLSFSNETLVLSIGENVEEVTDSGFLNSVHTIAVEQLGQDTLLQVHTNGLRHIASDGQVNEWSPPEGTYIKLASTNTYQVVVSLSNDEIVYFEVDEEDGQLNEYEDHKSIPGGATCLSLGDIPRGMIRSPFLAIGCADSTIRILSLDLGNTLEPLGVQALTATPSDVRIMYFQVGSSPPVLTIHIGLNNGVYIMSFIDSVTGQLSDTRTRFLGPKPIKLFKAQVSNPDGSTQPVIMALSTKTWVGGHFGSTTSSGLNFDMAPLSYSELSCGWSFSSKDCPVGAIGIEGHNIRIFNIDGLGNKFKQLSVGLKYTPRRLCQNSFSNYFYVIESDNGVYDVEQIKSEENGHMLVLDPKEFGYEHRTKSWASAIEVVNPLSQQVVSRTILQDNEAAFSICSCTFSSDGREYLIVGVAKDQVLMPKSQSGGFILVYKYCEEQHEESGKRLEFVHKTSVPQAPLAMTEFQGRLLVGVGNELIIFDLGIKQLLRKATRELPQFSSILTLNTQGNRIVVGDIRQSICFVVYKPKTNTIIPFADDFIARHVTTATMLDYDTVAAGDRFGNIFVLRCPKKISNTSDEDDYGVFLDIQPHKLVPSSNAAAGSNKLDLLSHFYVQDIPTSIQRASLVVGGSEVLVYTGLQGTIGALIPLISKQDFLFFQHLESLMRQHDLPLCGRDHLIYRGYYVAVKGCIDGDLCERYTVLDNNVREQIANELNRTVNEIDRKIADMRIQSVF